MGDVERLRALVLELARVRLVNRPRALAALEFDLQPLGPNTLTMRLHLLSLQQGGKGPAQIAAGFMDPSKAHQCEVESMLKLIDEFADKHDTPLEVVPLPPVATFAAGYSTERPLNGERPTTTSRRSADATDPRAAGNCGAVAGVGHSGEIAKCPTREGLVKALADAEAALRKAQRELASKNEELDTALREIAQGKGKTTMLKIIGGMAVDAYRADIHGVRITGFTEILNGLASVGVEIDENTLRARLREAAEHVPPRR